MNGLRLSRMRLVAAMAATVALVVLASPAGATNDRCASAVRQQMRSGGLEVIPLYTLHADIETDKKVYRVGDTVKVSATVTRPGHEDPAGQGIPMHPPASAPAEGMNVGIGIQVGRVFLFGFGPPTDARGKTTIPVKIQPYTPAGKAMLDAFAWKVQAEPPCFTVEERGYTSIPNAFTVKK